MHPRVWKYMHINWGTFVDERRWLSPEANITLRLCDTQKWKRTPKRVFGYTPPLQTVSHVEGTRHEMLTDALEGADWSIYCLSNVQAPSTASAIGFYVHVMIRFACEPVYIFSLSHFFLASCYFFQHHAANQLTHSFIYIYIFLHIYIPFPGKCFLYIFQTF